MKSIFERRPSISTILYCMYIGLREFVAGAALSWTSVPYLLKRRKETENLFVYLTLLELWGISPFLPRNKLFMLPHVVPQILYWRRRLMLWDDSLETADLKHIGH